MKLNMLTFMYLANVIFNKMIAYWDVNTKITSILLSIIPIHLWSANI